MLLKWSPLKTSLALHLALIVLMAAILILPKPRVTETYTVPIQYPSDSLPEEIKQLKEVKQAPVVLKSVNQVKQNTPSQTEARQVFGLSRDSYTDNGAGDNVAVKQGNTVAKEQDHLVLNDNDLTALPTPTEEYLVSEMPQVLNQVKPLYPKEARDQRLEGSVLMNVLIDQTGSVRQVQIIDGPTIFREVAKQAMERFKFKPAKVDGKAVAVRIPYTMRFELET